MVCMFTSNMFKSKKYYGTVHFQESRFYKAAYSKLENVFK